MREALISQVEKSKEKRMENEETRKREREVAIRITEIDGYLRGNVTKMKFPSKK